MDVRGLHPFPEVICSASVSPNPEYDLTMRTFIENVAVSDILLHLGENTSLKSRLLIDPAFVYLRPAYF